LIVREGSLESRLRDWKRFLNVVHDIRDRIRRQG
jgi:hypothetical protein